MKSEVRSFGLLVLIGMIVFASAVSWNGGIDVFYGEEENHYQYNFSENVSGVGSNLSIVIDTSSYNITWDNGEVNSYLSLSPLNWISYSPGSFILDINTSHDNQTGKYRIPFLAGDNDTLGTLELFWFQINATNDAPYFVNLNSSYDFPQAQGGNYTINALDEEEHYPLQFNLTWIDNCTHAAWSGMADNENCSLFNLSNVQDTSVEFGFIPEFNDVGTYWAYFEVEDFNATCPHDYCDPAEYEQNKSSGVYVLQINAYSSLTINASNCTGGNIFEGETFNCSVEVTTRGETDSLDFSSEADLVSRSYTGNKSWFFANATRSASDFFYRFNISVTPGKAQVGNWSIEISVGDGSTVKRETVDFFVDYNESDVSLVSIPGRTLYEDQTISVNATDEDLLIQDFDYAKREVLVFDTNFSDGFISITQASENHNLNYAIAGLNVNHSAFSEGYHAVNVSVTDEAGNLDWDVFILNILKETAPVWNVTTSNLYLTEDQNFNYNFSSNVSDPGENVSFYYQNVSGSLCSLNYGSLNSSSGVLDFIPVDCDVGYHVIRIIAGNGKLNSTHDFYFNVSNVDDLPLISSFTGENSTAQYNLVEGFSFVVPEQEEVNFSLLLADDDLLILDDQEIYYNENLTIDLVFRNSTGQIVSDLFDFVLDEAGVPSGENLRYEASFLPGVSRVDDYSVFMNVSDVSGNSVNRSFFINVSESLDAPVLQNVSNKTLTIHDVLNFSLNATDDEDTHYGIPLNYSVVALDGGPELSVNNESVYFNFNSNQSLSGAWSYNATVNDSDGMIDWYVFNVSVYGYSWNETTLGVLDLQENVSNVLNFSINHSVGDNLIYEFWIDNVSCWWEPATNLTNETVNCSYGDLTLRDNDTWLGNGSILGWDFIPNFLDESYGLLKNLTVRVYPNSDLLNYNQSMSVATNFSYSLNVSHSNAPMRAIEGIVGTLEFAYTSVYSLDLSNYFEDEDASDLYYEQDVSFSKSSGSGDIYLTHVSGWSAQLGTTDQSEHEGFIYVLGLDDQNESDISEKINIKFTTPPTTSSGGSSSKTKLKFYSLRIIVPEDVIISDEDYIEIPFGLENSGTIDLKGIDLSSQVLYNNEFADDVKIELGDTYIDVLKSGERQEYTMKILADTDRSGKYKASIFANITSPKFSDWGDFFIDLRRTNESEAEELLIFTEKLIADNPECLELTEVFRRAQEAFDEGNDVLAMQLADEVSSACEDAISANEQVRYKVEGFVQENFYYIAFVTLVIFFGGFIVYIYKRVRFNKSVDDDYIRGEG